MSHQVVESHKGPRIPAHVQPDAGLPVAASQTNELQAQASPHQPRSHAHSEEQAVSASPTSWHPGALRQATASLICIWICGIVFCLCVQLRRIVQLQRRVHRACAPPDSLTAEVLRTASLLALRPPRIFVIEGLQSPLIWCLHTPELLWPKGMDNLGTASGWRGIIRHELAHIKRHDHWLAWLDMIGGIIYWWNPLYFFIRNRLKESAELACDAWAISLEPDHQKEYAQGLLEISRRSMASVPVVSITGTGTRNRRTFERRLRMIFDDRVACKASAVGILVAIVVFVVGIPGIPAESVEIPVRTEVAPSGDQSGAALTLNEDEQSEPSLQTRDNELGFIESPSSNNREELTLYSLYAARFNDRIVDPRRLPELTDRRSLSLHGPNITDDVLEHLDHLTSLKELGLFGTRIEGFGLKHLRQLENLENIAFVGPHVTDEWLKQLPNLPNLKRLNLAGSRITDAGLRNMRKFESVEQLILTQTGIGDEGLQILEDMTQLKSLSLKQTNVSDEGLRRLQHVPKLEYFSLGSPKVRGPGLVHLQKMTKLKSLQFVGPSVTNEWMEAVEPLRSVADLELNGTNVTAAGLTAIGQWTQLRWLWLNRNPLSDEIVEHLKNLYKLEIVELQETNVTPQGAAELQAQLPDARIVAAFGQQQAPRVSSGASSADTPIPPATIRGRNYLVVPWKKTELQMWLIGSAGDPKENCKAYVLIDGHSFYTGDGKLDEEALDWEQLAKQLRPFADREQGIVMFHVLGIPDGDVALSLNRWVLQGFGEQRAGFYRAYVGQSSGRDKFWDIVAAATQKMKGRTEGPELPLGNDLVQAYPVQSFLSCLRSGNSDCVVRIVPRLEKDTGKALPPEIRQAILEYVPQVKVVRKGKLYFIGSCTKEGRSTADWFLFEKGADNLAQSLSYEGATGSLTEY